MGAVVFDILQEHICRKMPKRYPLRQVRIVLACLLARRMLLWGIANKYFSIFSKENKAFLRRFYLQFAIFRL